MTPAFRLVAACCRWPDDDRRAAAIGSAAANFNEWDELTRLADRHRVEPLVFQGLTSAGLTVPVALSEAADYHRDAAVRDLAETLRIAAALAAAGVEHRFLKGAPLGIAAYGSAMLKRSWDIDLLVLPATAVAATAILATLGYVPDVPCRPLDAEEFQRWAKVSKEAILRSPRGSIVELHWRVTDHPQLLPTINAMTSERSIALLGAHPVKTLEDAANIAYLAVHGTAHAWYRIKWIADFNALLQSIDPAERGVTVERARKFGTGHSIKTALTVASYLFTDDVGSPHHMTAAVQRLSGLACQALTTDDEQLAAKISFKSQWLLDSGFRYFCEQAVIRWRGSLDRERHPLPATWQWLYPILRIPLWLGRRLRRGV